MENVTYKNTTYKNDVENEINSMMKDIQENIEDELKEYHHVIYCKIYEMCGDSLEKMKQDGELTKDNIEEYLNNFDEGLYISRAEEIEKKLEDYVGCCEFGELYNAIVLEAIHDVLDFFGLNIDDYDF